MAALPAGSLGRARLRRTGLYGFATEPPAASRPWRVTIPHAGEPGGRRAAIPLGRQAATPPTSSSDRKADAARFALSCADVLRTCMCRLQRQGRSPRGVRCPSWIAPSTVSQISSPLRPTLRQDRAARFGLLRGVFIKLRFTKLPHSASQSCLH